MADHEVDAARLLEQVRSGRVLPKNWSGRQNRRKVVATEHSTELSEGELWLYGGLGGGAACTVLGVGLFGFYEQHNILGTIFSLVGLCGIAAMAILLKGHRLTIIHAAIGILLSTWLFFGYVIWFGPKVIHVPPVIINVPDVGQASQSKEMEAKLAEAVKERDLAKAELEKTRRELATIRTPTGSLPTAGDEVASLTVAYNEASVTIVSTSAHIKEATVGATISNYTTGAVSLGGSYSIPIKIKLDGEYGPFDAFIGNTNGLGFGIPNVSITKNEKSSLEILINPNSTYATVLFGQQFLISIRKQ